MKIYLLSPEECESYFQGCISMFSNERNIRAFMRDNPNIPEETVRSKFDLMRGMIEEVRDTIVGEE